LYIVQFVPIFCEGAAGHKFSRTARTGAVWLLPVFTLLGAFPVLGATAGANKDLLGESEVRTFGSAGLQGGELSLLDENALGESLGGSVALDLLECSDDGEALSGSEDGELVGETIRCEAVFRNDNRDIIGDRVSRGPRDSAAVLREDWRKLAFLSIFGVHVMKRLDALELIRSISSEAIDLPLFDENTFLWKEKKELMKGGFPLQF
jgi:hypothetical protein